MRIKKSVLLVIAILLLLTMCASLTNAQTAGSVPINGWQDYTGPNCELYITNSSYVDLQSLVEVINYDTSPIVLQVIEVTNGTIYNQVIEPQSSMILQLTFPDVTAYDIELTLNSQVLIEVHVERPSYYIMPTYTSGWSINQATTNRTENAVYTVQDVAEMLANLTLTTILLVIAVLVIGAFLGAADKAFTKFLTPKDLISILFCGYFLTDMIFDWNGAIFGVHYDPLYDLALVVGYQIGFWLWHQEYILPILTNCQEKTFDVRPLAVYLPDDGGGWCVQVQNNKELIKRLLGIPHRLGSDCGINPDWVGRFKRPYYPAVRGRMLWVQKIEEIEEPDKIWFFDVKRYTTKFKLAHASGIDKAAWLNDAKWYFRLQDMFDRLALKYSDLLLGHRSESTQMAAAMAEHSIIVNPAHRVSKFYNKDQGEVDLDIGESKYTVIESAAITSQKGLAKQTNEERERPRYNENNGPSSGDGEEDEQPGNNVNEKRRKNDDEEED